MIIQGNHQLSIMCPKTRQSTRHEEKHLFIAPTIHQSCRRAAQRSMCAGRATTALFAKASRVVKDRFRGDEDHCQTVIVVLREPDP